MICNTIVAIYWIVRFILANHWFFTFGVAFWLSFYAIFIIDKLYEKINGIYKNGLIFNGYISWNEIESYNLLNEESIFFIKKNGDGDGNGIVFNNIVNIEKIIEIININNVNEK